MVAIKLVPLAGGHLEFWYRIRNTAENRRHQPIEITQLDKMRLLLENFSNSNLGDSSQLGYKWVIYDHQQEIPVGMVSFHRLQIEQGIGRIGYTILPDFWGRGYGTAGVTQVLELIFTHSNMERIEAVCSIRNPASRRVLEKVGFSYEGIRRGYLKIRGRRIDHFSFSILKSDWNKSSDQ